MGTEEFESGIKSSHLFLGDALRRSDLDVFRVYTRHCKQQEHEHDLSAHDSEVADTVSDFHPASCILDLSPQTNDRKIALQLEIRVADTTIIGKMAEFQYSSS